MFNLIFYIKMLSMLNIILLKIKKSTLSLPYRFNTFAETICFSLSSTRLWIGLITPTQKWDSDCSDFDTTMGLYFPPGTSQQKCWTLYPLTGQRQPVPCNQTHAFLCEVWQGKPVRFFISTSNVLEFYALMIRIIVRVYN